MSGPLPQLMMLCGLSLTVLTGVTYCVVRRRRSRLSDNQAPGKGPKPIGPPIEEIAVGLRRLLLRHDRFARSDDAVLRARRMSELESAITWRATQAARALGVPDPVPPVDRPELRLLLRAIAAAGLVLPTAVVLMARDNNF